MRVSILFNYSRLVHRKTKFFLFCSHFGVCVLSLCFFFALLSRCSLCLSFSVGFSLLPMSPILSFVPHCSPISLPFSLSSKPLSLLLWTRPMRVLMLAANAETTSSLSFQVIYTRKLSSVLSHSFLSLYYSFAGFLYVLSDSFLIPRLEQTHQDYIKI